MADERPDPKHRPARADDGRDADIEGPPPREATYVRSDREREAGEQRAAYTSVSPALSGGDPDADWERGESVGEETVGGSVATPDQSVVDDIGEALGVPEAPDDEVRMSSEILDERDRYRAEQEDTPGDDAEDGAAR
jgi:hypothetical protein